jgi:hypothetical protein
MSAFFPKSSITNRYSFCLPHTASVPDTTPSRQARQSAVLHHSTAFHHTASVPAGHAAVTAPSHAHCCTFTPPPPHTHTPQPHLQPVLCCYAAQYARCRHAVEGHQQQQVAAVGLQERPGGTWRGGGGQTGRVHGVYELE